ncbi:MAG: hypothetical protein JKY92_03700 [Magnetovibrio sp.]|nr:hypothetical protein [Magnetovibrio sp.]
MSNVDHQQNVTVDIEDLFKQRIHELCIFFDFSHSDLDRQAELKTGTTKKLLSKISVFMPRT